MFKLLNSGKEDSWIVDVRRSDAFGASGHVAPIPPLYWLSSDEHNVSLSGMPEETNALCLFDVM